MERVKKLEEYIRDYWDERTEQKKKYIQKREQELEQELCHKLNILIKEQVKRQEEDEQRIAKYLFLCRLSSSGYTGSYDVMLGLSDSRMYLDEDMSYTYWYPKLIYGTVDKDMEDVTSQLRKKFIRLEKYELFYLKQRLLLDDWEILVQTYIRAMDHAYEQLASSSLVLDKVFLVLCGDYMEQLRIVKRMERDT